MGMLLRLLGSLPKNALAPVIFLLAGWYGGAKYGAPEMAMNTIDGIVDQATGLVGGFVGGNENADDGVDSTADG